jgi:aryl-alcohol dehydrogenase-like predicted oxidoreductase
MRYGRLGRTALEVSRLCLGTMNFGGQTAPADADGIMDRALEAGINFFDTANVYGGGAGKGATEEIVGRWLGQGGGRRDRIVLATKVFGRLGDGPNERGLSARHIRAACEASLRRLQTDHLDLYQMHHVDRTAPWEEIWQAMEGLVREGKVLYVGSSNFAGWQVARACETASARHCLGLVSEQSLYNLTARTVELEVLPACRAYGLGVLPWSPLAAGVLGGTATIGKAGRRAGDLPPRKLAQHGASLEAFEALCRELGHEPAVVALSWLLRDPVVTAPIIGPRTLAQLESALPAADLDLPAGVLARLDELFPGPGGEAPEAYAW